MYKKPSDNKPVKSKMFEKRDKSADMTEKGDKSDNKTEKITKPVKWASNKHQCVVSGI
jgi:hypothetical protein